LLAFVNLNLNWESDKLVRNVLKNRSLFYRLQFMQRLALELNLR
jgi:hypothetical protein